MTALATLILAFTNAMDYLQATESPDGVNNLNFLDFDHAFRQILTTTAIEELGPYGLLQFNLRLQNGWPSTVTLCLATSFALK
jgi:hypothetical protein